MFSKISQNSSFTVPSEMDEDIEVYIEYESETYPLDEVTDYQSLCQKIEENLEGVKTQELKITYKVNGMVVTVKNNSTFTAARKKMKPELKFTCTLNSIPVTTAPIAAPSQPVNPQFQATEPWGTTPSTFSQQPLLQWPNANFSHPPSQQAADGPFDILQNPLTRSMTSTSYTQNPIQNQAEFPSIPSTSTVTHQPGPNFPGSAHQFNLTPQMPYPYHSQTPNNGQQLPNQDTYPFIQPLNSGSTQQPSWPNNQFPPIISPHEVNKSYPSLVIQGQDAARCACGQFLSVSQPQTGTCPNQGCMLQANQTYTQLWSCQNQSDACGQYCWMCVQSKLRNCQMCVFEDVYQKNQVFLTRKNQKRQCQPNYNPVPFVPKPTPPKVPESYQLPQKIQPHQIVEQKHTNPPDELISSQDDFVQMPQKVVEAPNQLLKEISIPIEQKILGLDQNDLELLEKEVVEYFQRNQALEDEFIDYLCTEFKLDERKSELLKFCEKYDPKQPAKKYPTLPKIKAILTKKKIIDFIVNDKQTPQGFTLKKEFESLTGDQLAQFKECNKDFNAISFIEDDLFDYERELISQLFIDNKSSEEISKITLIHVELVEKICSLKENIMKKEIELLDLIRKYSSCKTNEDVIKLIDKDDEELVKVLIQAYINNKDEYLQITQKVKDKNFAINFESSQELTLALQEIDEEEERKRLPPVPIFIEPKILGLDKSDLEKLEGEVNDYLTENQTIEDEFLDHLIETYRLDERREELIDYLQKLIYMKTERKYPDLPKIACYNTKQNIINYIQNYGRIPSAFKLKKEFGNLTNDQLEQFKHCNQNFKAISFVDNDLFEEERDLVKKYQRQKKTNEEISKLTLIHIDLVQKFCDSKLIKLKEETTLIDLIRKRTTCKTVDKVIQLILKDNDELAKLLLKIYKENKQEYHVITKKLRDQNYAINFEQSQLQLVIKLAQLPHLDTSIEHQQEVLLLLKHFLNKDLVAYLMLLHDFTDIGQSNNKPNREKIILSQPHKDLLPAVVQLLILDEDQVKKNEVIESKNFEDIREDAKLKQLSEQIEHYFIQQFQKQKNEKPVDEQQFQCDEQHFNLNRLEMSENEDLVNTIQAISNITNMKIEVHSKSELDKSMVYSPKTQEEIKLININAISRQKDLLHLVRDDLQKVFYVMIEYENEKKFIDFEGLQSLKKKYPFICQRIPGWLDTFILLPSLRIFLNDSEADPKRMFEDFYETQKEFLQIRDEACKKKLYDAAVKFNLDSQLMQEWFINQKKDKKMADFCNFMINKGTRQKPHWKITQVDNIQQYFPMNKETKTLKDFNRVQTYQDPDDRKNQIEKLKTKPEEFTQFIINTLFGIILRKDDMSLIQSELEQIIKDSTISLRFLVSYLLQKADMGLRARLNYYLCQNKSVPLIMNCQQTFKDSNFMKYNQELVFSISDNEGVGVFAFGVGDYAQKNRCGKSVISNLIVTPKFDNKSFDENDQNVFSDGQIDVFFEKCYQDKKGWAFMDGQGEIPDSSLLSVLHLTNIVLIHFFQEDQNDETSVTKLAETLQLIKEKDSTIQICLIIRDCTETKEIKKSDYPAWLPCKDKVDKLIELINISSENRLIQKSTLIEKIILFFNETVSQIQSQNKNKFTKENFLHGFCKTDSQGKDIQKRIADIIRISNEFIKEVQVLKENVFNQQGLPSLKIKDQIRDVRLKLRNFQSIPGEDREDAQKREKVLKSELDKFTEQLSKLEVNCVMQQFWKIVNHKDAVQIKIEVSKSLSKFTEENIQDLNKQKKEFMKLNGLNDQSKKKSVKQSTDDIQKANDQYKQKMKEFEDDIFKRSLSYEYFWRSLICVMFDSKQCNYWSEAQNNENFKNAVQQQMLDGDTFELIDGRNLEIKADIIKQIVGYQIECSKCIVVCVIGPQSTGKSTLMNFCFGTQFLASTGRCTQGIYFTLQKIPPEMQNGSDVDYLIILDTEGLNSPERAEGERQDSEYDRKIVLFTLLCSDFLIINSQGDMSLQMKELIKICAVRYDELRKHSRAPKILYTFVRNSDNNPLKFKEQIQSLRSDVIESSDQPTIEDTANELMAVHDDLVKVLGSAYDQKLMEKDSSKGILYNTYINASAPLFGVHASDVWQQVQKFIQSGQHQFRQIGKWLQEAGDFWSLIDSHAANISQFGNVQQMKDDKKIKQYISQLWQYYINTQITYKDNLKAEENCRKLYEKFKDGDNIEKWKKEFIDENDQEKERDFSEFIEDKYQRWKLEPSQKMITVSAELKHMEDCKFKIQILKNDYKLLIESKFKELQMTQIHTSSISKLYHKARNLCQVIKKLPEVDQFEQINKKFEKGWGKLEKEISSESQIEQMRKTNADYLCRTFKSVNKFMTDITPDQFKNILEASDTDEKYPNSTLPIKLVDYLVNHISHNAFKDQNNKDKHNQAILDTKWQFQFDLSMLGMLIEDPKQRIFGQSSDAVKEKYLPLQKMLKVDYTYFIIKDFEDAIRKSSVFALIGTYLQKKKFVQVYRDKNQLYGGKIRQQYTYQTDDNVEIVNSLYALFQELGQAGFGLEQESQEYFQLISTKKFEPFQTLNVQKIFEKEQIFNNEQKKQAWVDSIKKSIRWKQELFKSITPRVQNLLCCDEVLIQNQLQPNISFEKHKKENPQFKAAKYTIAKPKLSYSFSKEDKYGKINVEKFLKEKNFIQIENYEQCLIGPKQYDMGESFKWTYLSELANAVVDWRQIVLDIDKSVSPQISSGLKKIKNKEQQADMKIDLKSVLERSLMNIEQAENIQTSNLQPIKNQLEYEVHQKLSLYVNHKLSGVITWVACVIIWHKLTKNIKTIFNEEIQKVKDQKPIVLKKFSEIAKGQTTATTAQFADDIFNFTFKDFNDNCLKDFNQDIAEYFQSKEIKDVFDTETVYKQMDEIYIGQANQNQYQECIDYATDPVKMFTAYVNELKTNHIVKRQEEEKKKYQQRVISNLKTLQERLLLISQIMKNYEDQKDDSINFFEVTKAGKKVEDDEEKEEIVSKMSPILLNTLRKILDGTYTVGPLQLTLTINNIVEEYSFIVKQKDPAKKILGSPYNDLQTQVFDKTKPQQFVNDFFERLDVCKDNANFGVCTDLRFMVDKLNDLLEQKVSEIEGLELKDIKPKVQDEITHSFVTNAIGCVDLCKFCNRKCESAPHQDDNGNHNCKKRGHSLRVFAGGSLVSSWGDIYPSLTTCDEIKPDAKIRIVIQGGSEVKLWQDIHTNKNRNWTTEYSKYLTNNNNLNPEWVSMYSKLENLWKIHGKRYCTQNNYKYIDPKAFSQLGQQANQMADAQIVIICLDESGSMFNDNSDFDKAVAAGKELEQYLKKNHVNPSQVHIQLWFNDCRGVNRVYKGQLSGTIPNYLWIRDGCQGDIELKSNTNPNFNYGQCGQFTGAVRILNQEVNSLLGSGNYNIVKWFFFTDGYSDYPLDEMNELYKTMRNNLQRWTVNGVTPKLCPMIITNQLSVLSLCQMKLKMDEIFNEIWQVEDACALKQNVQTDQLAKTMIEQFTFS